MGKTRKAMLASIEDIPNSKLEAGIPSDTIHEDQNLRLDNQGISFSPYFQLFEYII
jgi:hypothetical protein